MRWIEVSQCFAAGLATASDQNAVVMKLEAVFTTKGFNNNNNVQVIISGIVCSFCYKVAPVKLRVDKSKLKILLLGLGYTTIVFASGNVSISGSLIYSILLLFA